MKYRVLLALGSNIGDREAYLRFALDFLSRDDAVSVEATSSLWASEPVGFVGGEFLNAVVAVRTALSPALLLGRAKAAERLAGRQGSGSRQLDVDILYYDEVVVHEPGLEVPHPRRLERAFVLAPLREVCGDQKDPLTGRPLAVEAEERLPFIGPPVRRARGRDWWR